MLKSTQECSYDSRGENCWSPSYDECENVYNYIRSHIDVKLDEDVRRIQEEL